MTPGQLCSRKWLSLPVTIAECSVPVGLDLLTCVCGLKEPWYSRRQPWAIPGVCCAFLSPAGDGASGKCLMVEEYWPWAQLGAGVSCGVSSVWGVECLCSADTAALLISLLCSCLCGTPVQDLDTGWGNSETSSGLSDECLAFPHVSTAGNVERLMSFSAGCWSHHWSMVWHVFGFKDGLSVLEHWWCVEGTEAKVSGLSLWRIVLASSLKEGFMGKKIGSPEHKRLYKML